MKKNHYLKSSSNLDLLLFLSTLEELCLDLLPVMKELKGRAPIVAPMAPIVFAPILGVLAPGNIPWPRAKVLSAPGASRFTWLKRPILRPLRDGGGVREPVDPANPASPGEAILPTAP